jgi:CNT family concentrative nucleoside transporter
MAVLLALAWAIGEDRRGIRWRTVIAGLVLQVVLAVALIHLSAAQAVVVVLNDAATALQDATDAGTAFVFGYLGGGALPFAETRPGGAFILAFKILPLVLVISALGSLLFHWGVLQRLTGAFAWLLQRSMGVGGALALAAAVHIFVGMVEAPLLIRPYLMRMQRGEIFAVMTCGMAGVAGTVMVIYATILGPVIPNALGTILIASIISTPAGLAVAALMVPFGPGESGGALSLPNQPANSVDALVQGTADGVGPLVGIVSTLLVAVALVTLVNMGLGALPHGLAVARHEDGAERIPELPTTRRLAAGRVVRPQPGDHDLCTVRFRQFRQRWHPRWRYGRDGSRTACGDRCVRPTLPGIWNNGDVHERRPGGTAHRLTMSMCACLRRG